MKYDINTKFQPPKKTSLQVGNKVMITSGLYGPPFNKNSTHFILDILPGLRTRPTMHKIYKLAETMDTPICKALWFTEQQFKLISTP